MLKNVCIIAYTSPFTNKNDGGKMDILSNIKALKKMDCNIDFFSVLKKDEIQTNVYNYYVKNLVHGKIKNNLKNIFFSMYPASVNNRFINEISNSNIIKSKVYDLCIYENFNMYRYRKMNIVKARYHVCRVVNIESISRLELFKSSFPKLKSYMEYIEGIKYRRVEKDSLNLFDKFLFISKDEMETFEKKYPNYKYKFIWLPPSIEYKKLTSNQIKINNNILFSGDLTVSHNVEGIIWFIKNCFPKILIRYPNVKLNLIGRISSKTVNIIKSYNIKNINILGFVDDMESFIKNADFVIAPIFHGAGVKMKVLYALSQGKIVITTNKGIEGTTLKDNIHLLVADDYNEFTKKCIDIIENKNKYLYLIDNALKELNLNYSIESQMKIINSICE